MDREPLAVGVRFLEQQVDDITAKLWTRVRVVEGKLEDKPAHRFTNASE